MKKTFSNLLLSAALLLSPAVKGQQTTPPQPQATRTQSLPGRLDDDPAFKRLPPEQQDWVRKSMDRMHSAVAERDTAALDQLALDTQKHQILGMTLCGHPVDEATFVDAIALSSSSSPAIAIRWLDSKGTAVHTAISAGRRCVVQDGDLADGKVIARALPNSLAVSKQHALTAWEAEYWNSPAERSGVSAPHRGAFIENRFLAELDPHKASAPGSRDVNDEDRDFRWKDDKETLSMKPGVVLDSAPQYTYQNSAAPNNAQTPNAKTAPAAGSPR